MERRLVHSLFACLNISNRIFVLLGNDRFCLCLVVGNDCGPVGVPTDRPLHTDCTGKSFMNHERQTQTNKTRKVIE